MTDPAPYQKLIEEAEANRDNPKWPKCQTCHEHPLPRGFAECDVCRSTPRTAAQHFDASKENQRQALEMMGHPKTCKHDSKRLDGWLDNRCMNCGADGYWENGRALTEAQVRERDAVRHPSGKMLIARLFDEPPTELADVDELDECGPMCKSRYGDDWASCPEHTSTPETEIFDILKARAQNAPSLREEIETLEAHFENQDPAETQAAIHDAMAEYRRQYYHERETRVRRLLNAFDSTVTWRNIAILWTVALILWLVELY